MVVGPMRRRLQKVESQAIEVQRSLAGLRAVKERKREQILAQERAAVVAIEAAFNKEVAQVQQASGKRTTEIRKRFEKAHERNLESFRQALSEAHDLHRELSVGYGWAELPWEDPAWARYVPCNQNAVPRTVRVGDLLLPVCDAPQVIPALLPIIGGRNLVIKAAGQAKDGAVSAVQSVMLRLLAALPPGKVRFVFVDPVGLGSNVAGFLELPEDLYTGKAWTEAAHIEQQLANLSAHMETVIQTYLVNKYATMEEYNEKAGEVAEAYRLLFVANFPAGFSESAAQRLISIANNGLRTGVYVLAVVDTERQMPHGFQLAELERTATVIDCAAPKALTAASQKLSMISDGDGSACAVPAAAPEQDEFTVMLTTAGDKKLQVIKIVREFTGLGLKEAKDLVDGAPKPVKEGVAKAQAEEMKKKIEEAGGSVEVTVMCAACGGTHPGGGPSTMACTYSVTRLATTGVVPPQPDQSADVTPNSRGSFIAPLTAASCQFVWRDPDFASCGLTLDAPPPIELFDLITKAIGTASEQAKIVQVPFDKIALAPDRWWFGRTDDSLGAPIGLEGATDRRVFRLDSRTVHGLLIGQTGSGKSTLLHVLILNLAMAYSPDELELYLIDFKKGVEFKDYAVHQLPHARVVAIQSEREFGFSVLQKLDRELQERGDAYRNLGAHSLGEFRAKQPGTRTPRILLVVDEFQEFFSEDDAIARDTSVLLDRLVRQGRGFGMHVLLCSQNLGSYGVARSTIDQMAVRIALRCTEADSRTVFGEDNTAARMLSRPGEAIYNDANGLVEGNNKFQVVWLSERERALRLRQLRALADTRNWQPPMRQVVFEGDAAARIEDNQLLDGLLGRTLDRIPGRRTAETLVWLGEPVAIDYPAASVFRRACGRNLLIAGHREDLAAGMSVAGIASIAVQMTPSNVTFAIADFSDADSATRTAFAALADELPHKIELLDRRGLIRHLENLARLVEKLISTESTEQQLSSDHYLFVFGLHRARDLRVEDGFYPSLANEDEPVPPGQHFLSILREGGDFGIHVVAWVDTYAALARTVPRREIDQFELRVAMQMSAGDSSSLLDSAAASKLGPYFALLSDVDQPGAPKKFRPYGVPPAHWIASFGSRTKRKYAAS